VCASASAKWRNPLEQPSKPSIVIELDGVIATEGPDTISDPYDGTHALLNSLDKCYSIFLFTRLDQDLVSVSMT
jgi:hypothetical protein